MRQDSPRFRAALLHSIEQERSKKLMDFNELLKDNELTYLKFAFKTEERQENIYIKQFQKGTNFQRTGTMNIGDLWSNAQINRYLDISRFTKDKFLLQKLAKQNNKFTYIRKPNTFFSQTPRPQPVEKKDLKSIITELNILHKENKKLRSQINRKIYCKTVQF
ncbi:unnamed protein product [Paramecium primaurelia]|uniref:Uncharacterized protein n=2 Tax=Paramecium TaxID=5884 RepID=A0A8S1Y791_9CILI|nr:unnamed protein product [Paramecium primaurelia]CAD8208847.1 unnamed protein product [Paramecium pentaurelia]